MIEVILDKEVDFTYDVQVVPRGKKQEEVILGKKKRKEICVENTICASKGKEGEK